MNNCDYKSENKDKIKMASILKQTGSISCELFFDQTKIVYFRMKLRIL